MALRLTASFKQRLSRLVIVSVALYEPPYSSAHLRSCPDNGTMHSVTLQCARVNNVGANGWTWQESPLRVG